MTLFLNNVESVLLRIESEFELKVTSSIDDENDRMSKERLKEGLVQRSENPSRE